MTEEEALQKLIESDHRRTYFVQKNVSYHCGLTDNVFTRKWFSISVFSVGSKTCDATFDDQTLDEAVTKVLEYIQAENQKFHDQTTAHHRQA